MIIETSLVTAVVALGTLLWTMYTGHREAEHVERVEMLANEEHHDNYWVNQARATFEATKLQLDVLHESLSAARETLAVHECQITKQAELIEAQARILEQDKARIQELESQVAALEIKLRGMQINIQDVRSSTATLLDMDERN